MYNVRFGTFEGPLDLLLFFIKRDELDIYDIPIADITQEFLDYVRVMELLDLELAGEFVLMAATLVGIKAQMLLPRPPKAATEGENIDEHDPRAELVQKLLEYKRFKEASETLAVQADEQRYVMYRQIFEADELQAADQLGYRNATIFDLLKALKRAVERAPVQEDAHIVTRFPISVEEKSAEILHTLKARGSARFFELVGGQTRAHIVATFLALLELAKNHRIIVQQDDDFDDIIIAPRPADDAAPVPPTTGEGIEEDIP